MDILSINNLTKTFNGNTIIDNMSFNVEQNSVYGFIGKNGAGKTTTMKLILGLLKPDMGTITVCGEEVTYGNTKTNRFIGYLPDVPEFYNYMTCREYLKLCGEISGISKKDIKNKSEELLQLVGLSTFNKRIGTFSRGMKQRLGIAQALIHDPKLLICDEPTSALDPMGRKEVLDIILKVKDRTTVIFSTHVLSDVERVCDKVGILNKGNIILNGSIEEIKNTHQHEQCAINFFSTDDLENFCASKFIMNIKENIKVEGKTLILKYNNIEKLISDVMKELVDLKITPLKIEVLEPTLENLFLEVIK